MPRITAFSHESTFISAHDTPDSHQRMLDAVAKKQQDEAARGIWQPGDRIWVGWPIGAGGFEATVFAVTRSDLFGVFVQFFPASSASHLFPDGWGGTTLDNTHPPKRRAIHKAKAVRRAA